MAQRNCFWLPAEIPAIIFLCIAVMITAGCTIKKQQSLADIESVTLLRCSPDPAKYEVYVIVPDGRVTYYDFTPYWISNEYDYYTQPLPPKEAYVRTEMKLAEAAWEEIVTALNQNQFSRLPERMDSKDGYDLPSYEIEVKTEDALLRVGGYGAGIGSGKNNKHFAAILETIQKCINSCSPGG